MAFQYTSGVTDPEAPDEIVDWFSTFETWIASVGWTVVSGSGTTDIVISSPGEAGGLTKLFANLWRGTGGAISAVYFEVQDDVAGTNKTTRGEWLFSAAAQFSYFMAADKDAIVIFWKAGANYRMAYIGLIAPFALTVPDETYHSVAAGLLTAGTILRRHDGIWDQDDTLYCNNYMQFASRDRDDGTLSIGGLYFGDGVDIAGQLKHISCKIMDPPTAPEDTISTGLAPATSTWIILLDRASSKVALRTGGILPTGRADGTFGHTTGIANDMDAWFSALVAFMEARGWTAADITGESGLVWDWEFHSSGEDGTEDIWIEARCPGGGGVISCLTADSAYGTTGRHVTTAYQPGLNTADFPAPYWFVGDKDCLLMTTRTPFAGYNALWLGLTSAFAPSLSDSYMKVVTFAGASGNADGKILHAHDGNWNQTIEANVYGEPAAQSSNPNAYDGVTYLVWPMECNQSVGGGFYEPIGGMKYFFSSSGGGIASLDTITVGARTYTIFFNDSAQSWAMRTA